jgi:hypothetical protein
MNLLKIASNKVNAASKRALGKVDEARSAMHAHAFAGQGKEKMKKALGSARDAVGHLSNVAKQHVKKASAHVAGIGGGRRTHKRRKKAHKRTHHKKRKHKKSHKKKHRKKRRKTHKRR